MSTIHGRQLRRLGALLAALVAGATILTGAAASASADPPPVGPQVIGGHAPTRPYPAGAKVSLKYEAPAHGRTNWHTCGGYMPFQNTVVTNAHCVTDMPDGLSAAQRSRLVHMFHLEGEIAGLAAPIPVKDKQFWVRAGSDNKDDGGLTADATVVWVDPDWDWATGGGPVDDIAVLKLDHPLDLQTIQIAPSRALPRTAVYNLGWGVVNPDSSGPLPTMIQELQTTVVSDRQCRDAAIAVREICLANPNGTDGSCYGDSGGPAITEVNGVFYVVGGTSRAAAEWCGVVPTVFTSTPEHRKAIYDAARGVPVTGQPSPVSANSREFAYQPEDPPMGLPYEKPNGTLDSAGTYGLAA